jgi:CHAP domain
MNGQPRGGRKPLLVTVACVLLVVVVAVIAGTLMAILGSNLACLGSGGGGGIGILEQPTPAAVKEIPPKRLRLYQQASRRFDVDWTVLASIGYQECGTGLCADVYPSGCGGPMQIAIERESACSPGSGPTIFERYGVDADGHGADPFDLADAIFTAARLLRVVMGAPPTGGSYTAYRQAACNYYGACADSLVSYADEVMQRAVEYGFRGKGAPPPKDSAASEPASYEATQGTSCGASTGGGSASEIVRIAQSQLGQTERPLGSNCTKYGPCLEWCSLFVAWVWERAGVPLRGGTAPYAYSGSIYEWAQAHEAGGLPGKRAAGESPFLAPQANGARVLPPSATPSPGDAVLFGTGPGLGESDHVGIVERVFKDGSITTIDGNYSDRVARVGPFLPAEALASGEPAPIYGYAQPPSGEAGAGEGA